MNLALEHDPFFDEDITSLMKEMDNTGFFEHGLLIGSWPMAIYTEYFKLPYGFATQDVDFAIKTANTNPPETIPAVLKRLEYEPLMTQSGKETYVKGVYEIEFIVHRKGGKDNGSAVTVRPWDVSAAPLPFIDLLFIRPCKVTITDYSVSIPSPEALMLHKLIIAQRRTGLNKDFKKEKDLDQCKALSEIVQPEEIQQILSEYTISKATQKKIEDSCKEKTITLPGTDQATNHHHVELRRRGIF